MYRKGLEMSINRVFLVGNVTADARPYEKDGEVNVCTFSIAVNERRAVKGEKGKFEDKPNFFRCALFGNRASALHSKIAKGIRIAVEGHLRYSEYEKDGQKRSDVSIVVEELAFMTPKGENAANIDDNIPF